MDLALDLVAQSLDETKASELKWKERVRKTNNMSRLHMEQMDELQRQLSLKDHQVIALTEELRQVKRDFEEKTGEQKKLIKQAAKWKKQLAVKQEFYLKEKILNRENDTETLNHQLSLKNGKLDKLKNLVQKMQYQLQAANFECQRKELEMTYEREKRIELEHRMKQQEDKMHKMMEQKLAMRQRAAIYKERLSALEKSATPQLIQEKYENMIRDMEVDFAKKQRQLIMDSQKSLLAREEALEAKYRQFTENHMDLFSRESALFLERVLEVRGDTISTEIHEQLVQEFKAMSESSNRSKEESERRTKEEIAKQEEMVQKYQDLCSTFEAFKLETEKMRMEHSSSLNLLHERLHDREEELGQKNVNIKESKAEIRLLKAKLEKSVKRCAQLQATLSTASSAMDQTEANMNTSREEWYHKEALLEEKISRMEAEIEEKDRAFHDLTITSNNRIDQLQGELSSTMQTLNIIKGKHEELLGTMQNVLLEVKATEARRDAAETKVEELEQAYSHTVQEYQERLSKQEDAYQQCKKELDREKQALQKLLIANTELKDIIQHINSNQTNEIARFESRLQTERQKHKAELETQETKYRNAIERVERSVRLLQKMKQKNPNLTYEESAIFQEEEQKSV